MPRRHVITLSLLLTTLLLAIAPASAQIGGLVRRAKGAINEAKPATESAAPNIKPEDQLTVEHLTALSTGLDAEEAYRQNDARLSKNVKTPQAYQSCGTAVVQSPEFQNLTTTYGDRVQKAGSNTEASLAAAQKYNDEMKAMMTAKCGVDPSSLTGNHASEVATKAAAAGAKAAGVPDTRYGQWKERIVPFCNLPAAKRGSGVVRAEGYAYLASEAEALSPRCAALMPKIKLGN